MKLEKSKKSFLDWTLIQAQSFCTKPAAMGTSKGFTLLEIVIVLGIMSVLTLMSSQALRDAVRSRVKVQVQTGESAKVRDALKIIEADLNLAFNSQDLETEMIQFIRQSRRKLLLATTTTLNQNPLGGGPPPPPPPGGAGGASPPANPNLTLDNRGCFLENDPLCAPTPNRLNPRTHFVGKDTEIFFATKNAGRLAETELQADFINVGYKVEPCTSELLQDSTGNCLVRLSSRLVEGDLTQIANPVVLVEDITEFKLQYRKAGEADWIEAWDSRKGDQLNRFPDAVQVSLTIDRAVDKEFPDKKRKIAMQMLIPLRFTNNPRSTNPSDPNTVTPQTQPNFEDSP